MNLEKLNQWLTLLANVGVLVGIVFLVQETRNNTESNIIGIQEAYAGNFVQSNSLLASKEFSELMHKAEIGAELDDVEKKQIYYIVNLYMSQSNLMRRLYERGIISEDELRNAYNGIRRLAQNTKAVREEVMLRSEQSQMLILDDDGIDRYIDSVQRR